MFFSISLNTKDNFPNQYQLGKFVINSDNGWKTNTVCGKTVVYKGYADDFLLDDLLEQIIQSNEPQYTGNFCVFVYDNETIKIKTDVYRGFPIYANNQEITNLDKISENICSDIIVTINDDLSVTKVKFDIIGEIEEDIKSKEYVIDSIHNLLSSKVENFAKHNTLPIKAFVSGGVDSMLVFSYISRFTNAELLDYEHFELDRFYLKNSYYLKKLWAYKQIHHWKNPTLLTSGAPGDEFMLRSPSTANIYCIHHGTNILDLLNQEKYEKSLHYTYFKKQDHISLFEKQLSKNNKIIGKSKSYMKKLIYSSIINDYQHHHLGNTLTYTPLRDLRIMKLLLQLPFEYGVEQVMNSVISLEIIKRNNPVLLNHLSKQKNSFNEKENLIGLIIN